MGKDDDSAAKGVAAVDRAIAILGAFDHRNAKLDLADLARITGFYKSTILRLLDSLIQARLIERLPSGHYVLDIECGRLGAVYRGSRDASGLIQAQLQELARETGLTAAYFVRQGEYRVCFAVAVPPHDVFHHLNEGERLDLRQGAAGRLLCAYSGVELEESVAARRDGYLFRHGDRFPELSSLAAAVLTPGGQLLGALSLSGRASLFSDTTTPLLAAQLRTVAGRLTRLMQPGGPA